MQNLEFKTLRKTWTREEFSARVFNKSKSIGSKAVVESALINFDKFCQDVYGKNPDKMISDLLEHKVDLLKN